MAQQVPMYKVYDAEGLFVGEASDVVIAYAIMAHCAWDGWQLRHGHAVRDTVWVEGTDGHAKSSREKFDEVVLGNTRKPHRLYPVKRCMTAAESKEKQAVLAALEKEKADAKAARAAKRAAAAEAKTESKTESAPEATKPAATVRPIRPAPKSAAKPRSSKASAAKANVVHKKPTVVEAAGRVRKPARKGTAAKR